MRHRDSKPDLSDCQAGGQADPDMYTWREVLSIFVPGEAKPAGSKRAFRHSKTGKIVVIDDCKKSKDWQSQIRYYVQQRFNGPPLTLPIALSTIFIRQRPRSHYGTGRNADKVKPSAPVFPVTRPDRGKLLRAVEDALTGILYRDDAQIVRGEVEKEWLLERDIYPGPGVHIIAWAYARNDDENIPISYGCIERWVRTTDILI